MFVSYYDFSFDIIIYIRTSPETCMNRIITRGRKEELNSISLEYLQSIHNYHESWLINNIKSISLYRPKYIFVIDGNQSFDDVCLFLDNFKLFL